MNPQPLSNESVPLVRATDEDRERTASTLAEAFAHGSLDADEHGLRLSRAWEARHVGELATLTSDLPGPSGPAVARAQRDSDLREWLQEWRWWLGGAVILSGVWGVRAIGAGPGFFWPVVPLGVWAAILVAVAIWPREDK